MCGIILALFLAAPQVYLTWDYLPKSIRSKVGYEDKVSMGSLSLGRILKSLIFPKLKDKADGLFYPEGVCYIGVIGVSLAVAGISWLSGLILAFFILLAMGRHTTLWEWIHPLMLRIPARFCYFISLTLAFMAVRGLGYIYHSNHNLLITLILLQSVDLCLNTSRLWPMEPYTQRWEKPSKAFHKPYMDLFKWPWRVSGLAFPQRTGYVNHTRTLGYTGGAQLTSMARFRRDSNPNGSGLHDWFQSDNSQEEANWFGVKWAITYHPLKYPWKPTEFRHVYENTTVSNTVPDWLELGKRYGSR